MVIAWERLRIVFLQLLRPIEVSSLLRLDQSSSHPCLLSMAKFEINPYLI